MSSSGGSAFIDHYAVLGLGPDTPQDELKKAYYEHLREYHPDKRPNTAGNTGQQVTQALNQAWEVLRDPDVKLAYDILWRKHMQAPTADECRRKGNDMYAEARNMTKAHQSHVNLLAVQASMKKFQEAIEWYTKGLELDQLEHRFWSNRALCYSAVEDWRRCKDDARQCIRLKPDFMKGWFLLAKSLWKLADPKEAHRTLEMGLQNLPGCPELLEMQAEFVAEVDEMARARGRSRSVSPACTPKQSHRSVSGTAPPRMPGQSTPPRPGGSTPPRQRRKSPSFAAAAAASMANNRGHSNSPRQAAAGEQRTSSKSPGPSWRQAGARGCVDLDDSGVYECTGNFGTPTPNFSGGRGGTHGGLEASCG